MKYNQPLLIGLGLAAFIAVSGPAGFSTSALAEPMRLDPVMLAQATSPTRESSRDNYINQNEGKFEEWGRKIDTFAAKTADKSSETTDAAKRELDTAWTDTKVGWTQLKGASKDGWQEAKAAFEASWQKLQRAWDDSQKEPVASVTKE